MRRTSRQNAISLRRHAAFSLRQLSSATHCTLAALWLCVLSGAFTQAVQASEQTRITFKRIPTQFIAALGDPGAVAGGGAHKWGVWREDPGPRGVWLSRYDQLIANDGIAPAQWRHDGSDWWLDENGLIMEQPDFPLPPGRYLVTGDREVTTVLTVHPTDGGGERRWELANGATLHDVTHLACRSARYTPAVAAGTCSPANAPKSEFRVAPGASMPAIDGCAKQDYAVLFLIGVPVGE